MNTIRRSGFGLLLLAGLFMVFLAGCGEDSVSDSVPSNSSAAPPPGAYNIGNDVAFSGGQTSYGIGAGWTIGPITVVGATNVISLGIILDSLLGPTNMRLALYTDVGSVPDALIYGSGIQSATVGVNLFPVPNVFIPAGIYWIMFDSSDALYFQIGPASGLDNISEIFAFGTAWPNPSGAIIFGTGDELNLFMTVQD